MAFAGVGCNLADLQDTFSCVGCSVADLQVTFAGVGPAAADAEEAAVFAAVVAVAAAG